MLDEASGVVVVLAKPADQRAVPPGPRVPGQRREDCRPHPGAPLGGSTRTMAKSESPTLELFPTPLPAGLPSSEARRNTVPTPVASSCSSAATLGVRPGCTSLPIARNAVSSSCVRAGTTSISVNYPPLVSSGAYLLDAGLVPYRDGLELQRSLAAAVLEGTIPETIVLLEHPPVITTGRRTEEAKELHIPEGADVELVETDRGGKSTYHAPGQLVCYPILDLTRHGKDVRQYVRDLERAIVQTVAPSGLEATTIEGLTGVWMPPAGSRGPRKIASIGVRVSRWVTTHGYALNVDLDPTPFTEWITACGLDDAEFTTMARELGRAVTVAEVKPAALAALTEVFGLELDVFPAADRAGYWAQPVPEHLAAR